MRPERVPHARTRDLILRRHFSPCLSSDGIDVRLWSEGICHTVADADVLWRQSPWEALYAPTRTHCQAIASHAARTLIRLTTQELRLLTPAMYTRTRLLLDESITPSAKTRADAYTLPTPCRCIVNENGLSVRVVRQSVVAHAHRHGYANAGPDTLKSPDRFFSPSRAA